MDQDPSTAAQRPGNFLFSFTEQQRRQEKGTAACTAGIQTQCQLQFTWARDTWEPLSHRVSVTWVLLVGNASEERFPSELTRLGPSVLVKSSGKPVLLLSCRSHSESPGFLLPMGTW